MKKIYWLLALPLIGILGFGGLAYEVTSVIRGAAERGRPVVASILHYHQTSGSYPERLSDLVPEYFDDPNFGIGMRYSSTSSPHLSVKVDRTHSVGYSFGERRWYSSRSEEGLRWLNLPPVEPLQR